MATSLANRAFPTSLRALTNIKTPLSLSRPAQLFSRYLPSQQSYISQRTSSFATTSSKMSSQQFLDTVKARRSVYALKRESPISDAKIQDIVNQAILHVPSSFNSQSTRVVVLLKEEHVKLWEMAKEVLKSIVPAEQYPPTEQRLNGFQAGYGTVLFFEHRPSVTSMQEKFALYADKFPGWAAQSDGMAQFVVWTALEAEGLGCNLQHYNPLIDQKVASTWNVDKDWELNAQLVFGAPIAPAGDKEFIDIKERVKVYGA